MNHDITRRDFINGTSLAIGSSLISPALKASTAAKPLSSAQNMPGYYPPTLVGMRGSHPGSFELGHLIRDGKRWDKPSDSIDTGEMFDLVVVGGGVGVEGVKDGEQWVQHDVLEGSNGRGGVGNRGVD